MDVMPVMTKPFYRKWLYTKYGSNEVMKNKMYNTIANKTAIFVYHEIICIYFKCHLDNTHSAFSLTHKQLKIHGCILSTVPTVASLPKHQAISRCPGAETSGIQ